MEKLFSKRKIIWRFSRSLQMTPGTMIEPSLINFWMQARHQNIDKILADIR